MENPKEALHEIVYLWKIKQAKNLENQDKYRDKFRYKIEIDMLSCISYWVVKFSYLSL